MKLLMNDPKTVLQNHAAEDAGLAERLNAAHGEEQEWNCSRNKSSAEPLSKTNQSTDRER